MSKITTFATVAKGASYLALALNQMLKLAAKQLLQTYKRINHDHIRLTTMVSVCNMVYLR